MPTADLCTLVDRLAREIKGCLAACVLAVAAGFCTAASAQTVAYWPFGDYGVNDASGNGYNLTTKDVEMVEDAVLFNGSTSWCRTENTLDLSQCDKGLTVELFLRVPVDANTGKLYMVLEQTVRAADYSGAFYIDVNEIDENGGNQKAFRVASMMRVNETQHMDLSKASMNDGKWHHVALVYDPSKVGSVDIYRLYVDGVQQLQYSNKKPTSTVTLRNDWLYFGCRAKAEYFFRGEIDDVRISDMPLEPSQFFATVDETQRNVHHCALTNALLYRQHGDLV